MGYMNYEERLEVAKRLYELSNDEQKTALECIFPELCESEDEKVREDIISLVNEFWERIGSINPEYSSRSRMLAWLEKQGTSYTKRDVEDAYIEGMVFAKNELEKQGEQKPTNKVEPKFHEGDWIVNKFGDVWHIDSFDNKNYQVSNGNEYNYFPISKQNEMNLWTIQDAKDGDVIYFNNDISGFHSIGLFKRLASKNEINGGTYRCYARYGGFNEESKLEIAQNNNELHHFGTKAYPATKEQRDTLMKAMTDAGWKFDFKKKELMKIEKNTDVNHEYFSELLENDDSKDINDYAYQVAYCISHDWLKETATWDDVEKACKLGAEWNKRHYKSAWSDEDKKIIGRIRSIVEKYAFSQSAVDVNGDLCEKEYIDADNWLKSLKDRVYPKQEWKQENTDDLTDFENAMMHIGESFFGNNAGLDPNDIDAIKEQANTLLRLVPSKEWSEEDEQYLLVCKNALAKYQTTDKWDADIISCWLENKLKVPQNRWKPSDAQMEALNQAKTDACGKPYFNALASLYVNLH